MENKNDIPNEFEKEAPFLSKIKKENHFSTPENYFEVLPEVISYKMLNNNTQRFLFDKLSYRILIPITTLVVIFVFVFNWNDNSNETEITSDQLSELIIDEGYVNMNDYLVYDIYAEILEEDEIEDEEFSDTEDYIDYLIENDIDLNSIIEEL